MHQLPFWPLASSCGLLAVASHTQSPTTPAEREVSQLVRDFRDAEQAYDPTALARLTDEHYVEISPRGEVDERARFLGFYQPELRKPWPPVSVSEEQIRVFGTTALEVLKFTYTLPGPDGTTRTQAMRATFVAQRGAAGWRLVGAQYTAIVVAPPPAASGK
ncbi:MAG: nuclear transport factor 2 family protein [Janthinobacterium lividum]